MKQKFVIALLVAMLLAANTVPAFAQDPNGAWGEVLNSDGSINYGALTDGGVVSQPASWMPSIPFVGPVEAEYHVYYTPSGNQVLMPTATTLFFMAANPQESGYLGAASTLGTNGGSVGADSPNGIAALGALAAALTYTPGGAEMMQAISQAGFNGPTAPQDFFSTLANGQTDIWSLNPAGLGNFLTGLFNQSISDGSLYTYMLLYTPDGCGASPAGCSPDQLALLTPLLAPDETPVSPNTCPAPVVRPGAISFNGQKMWPPYPLVVGQDPEKTGVDVVFSASVAPTIYTYYEQVPILECVTTVPGRPCRNQVVGYECRQRSNSYSECIESASAAVTLSRESRDWILNELSIRYPEAYLHHPSFGFSGSGCSWSASDDAVQVADPGYWNMSVRGNTSGTPVSPPRSFAGNVGTFEVWLKEIAIIK